MNRPNYDKLQDLYFLACGVQNLCAAMQDRANSGSAVALDYLCGGMENRLHELSRTWETIRAGIYK